MRLDDVMLVLKSIPLFRRVEPEALRILAFSAVRRQLRAGDILFRRGERSDGGFLIVDGEIVLDVADDGSPSRHVFGAGALIGSMALFAAIERPATAIARDGASVLVFSRELILKVLDAYPQAARALQETMAEDAQHLAASITQAVP